MSTAYGGNEITFPDNSVQNTAPKVGMVNRLINSDMRIDQRNAGAAVTVSSSARTYSLDRWTHRAVTSAGTFTVQQVTDAPEGFTNSLKATVGTAAGSLGATDLYYISQLIEGYNTDDIGLGQSTCKTMTYSFWVKSSVTGTLGGTLAGSWSYPFSYTINAANTWEHKTISIPSITSGGFGTGAGISLNCLFGLGIGSTYLNTANTWASGNFSSPTGSVNLMATSGATFYVTGVQLEKGSTATDFEYVDYGRQLQMCQRYFETAYDIVGLTWFDQVWFSGNVTNGSTYYCSVVFKVSKRTNSPTVTTFRLGESGFSTAAPTVGNATNVGFSANKAATGTGVGNYVFAYYVSNEL